MWMRPPGTLSQQMTVKMRVIPSVTTQITNTGILKNNCGCFKPQFGGGILNSKKIIIILKKYSPTWLLASSSGLALPASPPKKILASKNISLKDNDTFAHLFKFHDKKCSIWEKYHSQPYHYNFSIVYCLKVQILA